MKVYKYRKGLFGTRLKGYKNQNKYFDVQTDKNGIKITRKNGEVIFNEPYDKNVKINVQTNNDIFAIEGYDKKLKESSFLIYKDGELIKQANVNGAVDEIIVGAEDVYFKKFVDFSGNRFYHKIVKDGDVQVTPSYQIIVHDIVDGKDKFYCENYRELSRDEFLEEDDSEYENNLEETATYLSNGVQENYRTYSSGGSYGYQRHSMSDTDKNYATKMLMGASILPLNPVAGSTIMAIANIEKSRANSGEYENQPGNE